MRALGLLSDMKRKTPHGFTLIEMITVVAIIIVLAGLVIGVAGYANKKAAAERAFGEIKGMTGGCENYKVDYGSFPQTLETDTLDPRIDVSPLSQKYQKASLDLYSALSGDYEPAGSPDFKPESGNKSYYPLERTKLSTVKAADGAVQKVTGIQDPFGMIYGYSTAAAKEEAEYRKEAQINPNKPRQNKKIGFNPTFDLWSTAGATTPAGQVKWVKNWSN